MFEALESRCLLSAQGAALMSPTYVLQPSAGGLAPLASSGPSGLTPTQIRDAYGFNLVGDGTGQTIAIIDAYNDPTIVSDLHNFDAYWTAHGYSLPDPPNLTVVSQTGSTTNLPPTDPAGAGNDTWEVETSLDVEWAHVVGAGANILLVEANSPSNSDLITAAVGYARSQPNVSVVTMSFGGDEFSGETSYDSLFTTPNGHIGITFLASTGDNGEPAGYPAYSPNVVAVGGTTLSVSSGGGYLSETGWSDSGGGVSTIEAQPSYQSGIVTQSTTKRTRPTSRSTPVPIAASEFTIPGTTVPRPLGWITSGAPASRLLPGPR